MIRLKALLVLGILCVLGGLYAAPTSGTLVGVEDDDYVNNVIQVTVPFLNISPDSRGSAMGDGGAANSPDINSLHWNASKYAFIKDQSGLAVSYSPWLKNLVNDMALAYLTYFKRLDNQQTFAFGVRYFNLGEIIFTREDGTYDGQHTPNEFTIEGAYARKFSDNFSGGTTFRFIRSDLTGNTYIGSESTRPGTSGAADLSAYYRTDIKVDGQDDELAFGLNISNIGAKISYSESKNKSYFIPTNLRLGSSFSHKIDAYNSVSFLFDVNKLLVPTPDSLNMTDNGNSISIAEGMFQSFYDAPGGYKEELHEIMYSVGAEYWYRNQFAFRGGYFNEHQTKGNRKFFTFGVGLKLNVFNLDFSYLVPTLGRSNPLANTMRFSLSFVFGDTKDKNSQPNNR